MLAVGGRVSPTPHPFPHDSQACATSGCTDPVRAICEMADCLATGAPAPGYFHPANRGGKPPPQPPPKRMRLTNPNAKYPSEMGPLHVKLPALRPPLPPLLCGRPRLILQGTQIMGVAKILEDHLSHNRTPVLQWSTQNHASRIKMRISATISGWDCPLPNLHLPESVLSTWLISRRSSLEVPLPPLPASLAAGLGVKLREKTRKSVGWNPRC